MEQPVRTFKETLHAEMRRFLNGIPSAQIEHEIKFIVFELNLDVHNRNSNIPLRRRIINFTKIIKNSLKFIFITATQLDLIIIPRMAYDLDGNRLGYSGEEPYD
ncbi:hypothetical protein F8M41_021570 [Gigaspora margarita]|uniref:Uncharacterized protein n=1 Tax=Gigaspora margarita TaxID=4874 RepID=A0A8H4AGM9_GIGMA|nr:hypothetical protein F8M41_021570 [Gigaspora margarita]